MKTITLVMPVNNAAWLPPQFFDRYKTEHSQVLLRYPHVQLDDLKSGKDIAYALPLLEEAIINAINQKTSFILVGSFGDMCIHEANEFDPIPKVSAGRLALRALARYSKKKFTVIPLHMRHLAFIDQMLQEESIKNYMAAPAALQMSPKDYHQEGVFEHVLAAAKYAIEECGADALAVGCCGYHGLNIKLQNELALRYQYKVHVVEPIDIALKYVTYQLTNY